MYHPSAKSNPNPNETRYEINGCIFENTFHRIKSAICVYGKTIEITTIICVCVCLSVSVIRAEIVCEKEIAHNTKCFSCNCKIVRWNKAFEALYARDVDSKALNWLHLWFQSTRNGMHQKTSLYTKNKTKRFTVGTIRSTDLKTTKWKYMYQIMLDGGFKINMHKPRNGSVLWWCVVLFDCKYSVENRFWMFMRNFQPNQVRNLLIWWGYMLHIYECMCVCACLHEHGIYMYSCVKRSYSKATTVIEVWEHSRRSIRNCVRGWVRE